MTNQVELRIGERFTFAGGHEFGAVGPYERLVGRSHFAVDPTAAAQRGITDIEKAPRDADGLVRFAADFSILKPADPRRGNRRIFFDYGNRGNKRMLQFFNDAPASNDPRTLAHAGNGFLMRRGYTVVWLAWQGDLLPGNGRMVMDLPVARDSNKPITGPVRVEYIADRTGITTFPLSGHASTRSHPTVSLDPREAQLTRRRYPEDERIPLPPDSWCFARVEGGTGLDNQGAEHAVIPSDTHIHIPSGFEPGWIYELVYTGRDPLVLGLGHAAVRDFVSFLRYSEEDAAGLGTIEKAYAWGRSQTGRCLRDFVYRGFNADAAGRKVFDGILPHVAGAGRMWLNHRFANAVVSGGQQYEDHFNIADSFPFSYAETTDHLTERTDAILKRPQTDPLVIHTQTSTEYWQRRGSLVHTDTRGNDLAQPPGVRIYIWASSQHFADPTPPPLERGVRQNYLNTVATSMLFRAMIDAMDRWATEGIAPPDSRIPRRCRRHAGDVRGMAPTIPPDRRGGNPARAELVAAIGFRARSRARRAEGAAGCRTRKELHGARAGGRQRRQRHRRRQSADGRGAARHLLRLEPAGARFRQRRDARIFRQLHPVAREPGRATRYRRSAAIDPRALPEHRRLCRGNYGGGAKARRSGIDARRRCRTGGCGGSELGPAAPRCQAKVR
jgi:hypothetical protein